MLVPSLSMVLFLVNPFGIISCESIIHQVLKRTKIVMSWIALQLLMDDAFAFGQFRTLHEDVFSFGQFD
jgi:hypothetical protein